ncbi:MAG: YihY/virulence factor BrkB family protein [Armatimonadota bacterium]
MRFYRGFTLSSFVTFIVKVARFFGEVFSGYRTHNGTLASAALSFTIFLTSIPVVLLFVAGFGYLLGSPERAREIFFEFVRSYTPTILARHGFVLENAVDEVIRGRHAATIAGFFTLLWSGSMLVVNIEQVINLAWKSGRRRTFLLSRLLSIGLICVAGILLLGSFLMTTALEALRAGRVTLMGVDPGSWTWLWNFVSSILVVGTSVIAFFLLYELLPSQRPPFLSALIGALFTTAFWELVKRGFSFYIAHYASFGKIYGPLSGVMAFMIWIHVSSFVFILGAEVSATWARQRKMTRMADS